MGKLSTAIKEEIEKKVVNKLTSYNMYTPQIDLIHFLKTNESFKVILTDMPDNTTGLILVNDSEYFPETGSQKLIAINSKLKSDPLYIQKRRYIVAHEYGHYVLHKNQANLYAHRDSSHKDDIKELEADYFARCILMPREFIVQELNSEDVKELSTIDKIKHLSKKFNVTEKKAVERFKDLIIDELQSEDMQKKDEDIKIKHIANLFFIDEKDAERYVKECFDVNAQQ